jgi:hypothetical protein
MALPTPEEMNAAMSEESTLPTPEEMNAAQEAPLPTPEEMNASVVGGPVKSASDILETRVGGGDAWTPTEIAAVAKKHGVPEDFVKREINWAQGQTQEQADADLSMETLERDLPAAGRVLAGTVDKALAHIPSSLFGEDYTKEQRQAIDDIREISSKKLSLVSDIANIGGMLSTGGEFIKGAQGLAKISNSAKLLKAAEHPIGVAFLGGLEGAAYGAGEAKEGQTLDNALTGALFGGALGGAFGLGSKFLKKSDKPDVKEVEKYANDIGLEHNKEMARIEKLHDARIRYVENYLKAPPVKTKDTAVTRISRQEMDETINKKINSLLEKKKHADRIGGGAASDALEGHIHTLRQTKRDAAMFIAKGKEGLPNIRDEMVAHFYRKNIKNKLPDPATIKKEGLFGLSMMDSLQGSKIFDGKWNSGMEDTFIKLGEGLNHAKNITRQAYHTTDEFMKDFTKNKWSQKLDTDTLVGKEVGLTPREEAIRGLFDDLADKIGNKFGVEIPRQKGYIAPRVTKTHQEWLGALDAKLREFGIIATQGKKGKWQFDKEAKDIWKKISGSEDLKNLKSLKVWRDVATDPAIKKLLNTSQDIPMDRLVRLSKNNKSWRKLKDIPSIRALENTNEWHAVKTNEIRDLMAHVQQATGSRTQGLDSIAAAFNQSRGIGKSDEFDIARLMRRDEDAVHIPEWALETDVEALAYRYGRDLSKGLAIRKQLIELETYADIAKKSGDGGAETWIRDIISDTQGLPRMHEGKLSFSPAQSYSNFMEKVSSNALIRYQRKENLKDQAILLAPHVANLMTRLIYPNLLSKPISMMKNIASPYFSTMPYLLSSGTGGREAVTIAMQASADTARMLGPGMQHIGKDGKLTKGFFTSLKEGERELLERGLVHSQFTGDMAEKLAGESVRQLKKDKLMGKVFRGGEKFEGVYNNTLTYTFRASETIARLTAMNMGKNLASRMASRPDFGKKVLASVDSPSLRSKWRDGIPNINTTDYAKFEDDIISLINANTMFNYDRANMAGYGRYMGPLFSQFSKWPLMMLGKVMAPFAIEGNREASKRVLQALFLPMAVGMAVDKIAEVNGLHDDPTYRTWVGKLQSYSPGDALLSLLKEDSVSTPALQFLFGVPQILANPSQGIPDTLQHSWEYFGGGGAEKLIHALGQTGASERTRLPSQELIYDLKTTLRGDKP